jgi:hypothetical protein
VNSEACQSNLPWALSGGRTTLSDQASSLSRHALERLEGKNDEKW